MMSRILSQARRLSSLRYSCFFALILIAILLMAVVIGISIAKEPARIEGVVTFNRQPRGHDSSLIIPAFDLPPVGGVHHDMFQNCGIYSDPIEAEKAVQSMEHGAVWITYQEGLPEADIAALQQKVAKQQFLLLSPFPGQRSQVVLSSWGSQLELDSAHDERLEKFINRYRLGPATPERGASCTGGFGSPLPRP
ncbi:MAG TPA: DUF3105 domain-containing protein [candidate division Zixibacteria bacterium]|nr:DUF3105 domain-containing protein [candidate division Zixibacteria bacterium]